MGDHRKPTLTRDDWARAALAAMARGGVDAVAVETVAADLGATKGSFYWHFKNRDALLDAALGRWEQRTTEVVIDELERERDPAERLRKLLTVALAGGPVARAEIALLANPDHPAARRTVRQAARRRIAYLAEQFEELGWDPSDARARAVLAYYLFLGHMQMNHVAPDVIGDSARSRHLQIVLDALVGDPPGRSQLVRQPAAPACRPD